MPTSYRDYGWGLFGSQAKTCGCVARGGIAPVGGAGTGAPVIPVPLRPVPPPPPPPPVPRSPTPTDKQLLRGVFPDGVPDGVTVTADDTISGLLGDPLSYNCIGWTLCSRLFRFVWPPPAIDRGPAGPKLAWFDKLYLSHGWHIAASCTPARGKRKIALYCDSNGPTHAAKQVKDDLWESKCGVAPRITHHGTAALAGGLYGQVCRCYEKSLAALVQEAKAALDDFTKGIQQGIGGDMKDAKAEAEQRVRDLEEALAQEGSN